MSLDETALSNGELYTILTNKARKGKKGTIVGIFKGTQSKDIIDIIQKNISSQKRKIVREITLDMANNMNLIAKTCFLKADRVTDRFHVQKLVWEAVQDMRIKYRWEALDSENQAYQKAKEQKTTYHPETLPNGDTIKQLLVRSRYALYKPKEKWTPSQCARAELLFEMYPLIEKVYNLGYELYKIYNQKILPDIARTKLAHWFNDIELSKLDVMNTVKRTFEIHYETIINFFNSRSTNAAAESFNAKIKDFRRNFRGVTDVKFFLYRLTKIYA